MSPASPEFVAVIESACQLDLLMAALHDEKAPLIVAMTAEADYACERRGVSYTTIEDYYSEQDLYRESRGNRQRLEAICDSIDDICTRFRPAGTDTVLFSARSYRYHLRILLDSLLFRTYQLTSLLQTVKPEHLLYFQSEAGRIPDDLLFSNESLSARIIPVLAEYFSVLPLRVFDPRPVSVFAPHQQPETAPMLDLSKPLLLLANFWMNREVLPEFCSNGGQIVCLDDLLGEILSHQPAAQLPGENFNLLLQALQADPAWKKLFLWNDIDLYPVVSDRVCHFIQSVMPRHILAAQKVASFLQAAPPAVVMGNSPVRLADIACFAAARHCKVPTVVYQHGIFGNNTDYEQTDTALSDYILCFGKGETDFVRQKLTSYDQQGRRLTAEPVSIGSSQYDSLYNHYRNSSRRQRPDQANPLRIVYALGTIVGDTKTFDGKVIADSNYWRLERDVISLCCSLPNLALYVKLFPRGADAAMNPVESWLKDQKKINCTIVSDDIPFTQLLAIGDLFITDIPSSVLIEASLTTKPIVVMVNEDYYPEPFSCAFIDALKKRAFVATSKNEFFDLIHIAIEQCRDSHLVCTDTYFIKQYATHLDDGLSAERGANLLFTLATTFQLQKYNTYGYPCEQWLTIPEQLKYSDYWNNEAIEQDKEWWILDGDFRKMEKYLTQAGFLELMADCINTAKDHFGKELKGVGCDLAAGNLWGEPLLLQFTKVEKIYCVEYSRHRIFKLGPVVLSHYNIHPEKVVLALGDIHELRLADASIDFFFLSQAFHHSDNPLKLLREMQRTLKKDGFVIIIGEHYAPDENNPVWLPPDPVLGDHVYTLQQYELMFNTCGFQYKAVRLKNLNIQGFILIPSAT